jgi:acetyltransferase
MGDLARLFAPDRVAVVGATDRPGSVGRAITSNLLADFDGTVVPVNPTKESVFELSCVDSLADTSDVDVAVVAVPPDVVLDVLKQAGQAGVGNVVVVTAGFGESGSEGAARERDLRAIAERFDLNVVGPNSLGIISTGVGLNATFAPQSPPAGNVSFLSQSGAFVTAVLDWAEDRSFGFKDVVSLGNKAVLDERDFVREWDDDPETDVIMGYLEDVVDGRSFIETAREVTAETPIVLVKSGRTEAGASAAASHTGALAGSDRAYETGLQQAGVVRAETTEQLFDAARILADQPLPDGDSVAIVTNAGGPGVMATDAVGDSDLSMASFAEATVDALSRALPDGANIYNPVDVVGDADVERFGAAIEAVVADPNVDALVVVACPTAPLSFEALADTVAAATADRETPVAVALMGGSSTGTAADRLSEADVPSYFDPGRAVDSVDVLREYAAVKRRTYDDPMTFDVDRARARDVLDDARRDRTRLGVEAMDLLDAYGIPTPAGEIVTSPGDAERAAADVGGDVVMKVVSPDILHKSDIGGVEVGVAQTAVRETYENLVTRARNYQPDATILGVQVQAQLDLDDGVETIVGANRDPQFGPVLLFGLGGIFVEVLEDTAVRVAPVGEREARELLDEVDAAPLLRGARGRDPVDEDALVETIGRLSQLVTDFPAIVELDVNPLLATPAGATAVDLRLTIDTDKL